MQIFNEFKGQVDYLRKGAPEGNLLPVIRELIPILKINDTLNHGYEDSDEVCEKNYKYKQCSMRNHYFSIEKDSKPLSLNSYINYLGIPLVQFLILIKEFSCVSILIEVGADLSLKCDFKINQPRGIFIYNILFLEDSSKKNQILQDDSEEIKKLNYIFQSYNQREKLVHQHKINFEDALSNFNNQLEEISKKYFPDSNITIALILKDSFNQFISDIHFRVLDNQPVKSKNIKFNWFSKDSDCGPDMLAVDWNQLLDFLVPQI